MISSSPRSVMRKRISSLWSPARTSRFTHSLIVPALLCEPSMFQMVRGFLSLSRPIFILFRILVLIKLSVAPESTRTFLSAVECEVFKRVGIRNDLYLLTNVLFIPITRAQADGVACLKNPLFRLQRLFPLRPPFLKWPPYLPPSGLSPYGQRCQGPVVVPKFQRYFRYRHLLFPPS